MHVLGEEGTEVGTSVGRISNALQEPQHILKASAVNNGNNGTVSCTTSLPNTREDHEIGLAAVFSAENRVGLGRTRGRETKYVTFSSKTLGRTHALTAAVAAVAAAAAACTTPLRSFRCRNIIPVAAAAVVLMPPHPRLSCASFFVSGYN